jgi:metallophosphoesterase (TIGR00282 family)
VLDTPKGPVAVLNVRGLTYLNPPLEDPFRSAAAEVENLRALTPVIFVDFHAETTSEKIALGHYLDGKVSAVVGTHTHVQTADDCILPNGTAYLTDAGMCGPDDSVLGRVTQSVIWRFKSGLPTRFPIAKGPVRLCGAIAEIDTLTGKCLEFSRYNHLLPPGEL